MGTKFDIKFKQDQMIRNEKKFKTNKEQLEK